MERRKNEHITLTGVKERGWTDAMVRDLLGPPDKLATNPHYASAPPVKLFAVDRVEAVEKAGEFKLRKEKAEARAARSLEVAELQKQKTIDAANRVNIRVTRIPIQQLTADAKIEYSRRKPYAPPPDFTNKEFAERNMVNYIRHNLSDYKLQLRRLAGQVGVRTASKNRQA